MSETIRSLGFEAQLAVAEALPLTAILDTVPVAGPAIDLTAYPGCRILAILSATVVAHGVTWSVAGAQEAGGPYNMPLQTSGDLSTLSADGHRLVAIQRHPQGPFLKITATGDSADTDATVSALLLFVGGGMH